MADDICWENVLLLLIDKNVALGNLIEPPAQVGSGDPKGMVSATFLPTKRGHIIA